MEIRKSDISDFLLSFGSIRMIENVILRNTLIELSEQLNVYILYGKPSTHLLSEWETNVVLFMSGQYENTKLMDLYTLYLEYLRNKQLEKILV